MRIFMQLTCFPAAVCGKTVLPPSKSHAVRLIAAGLMSASPLKIISLPRCDDVAAALSCAEAMGAQLRDDVLFPPASFSEKSALNCRDSGCAMRFFTAIAAFAGGSHRIYGSRTLMSSISRLFSGEDARKCQVSGRVRSRVRIGSGSNFMLLLNFHGVRAKK